MSQSKLESEPEDEQSLLRISIKRSEFRSLPRYQSRTLQSLDNYFQVTHFQTDFRREIFGGISMFLVSLYILFTQPKNMEKVGIDFYASLGLSCVGNISTSFFFSLTLH